MRPAGETSEDRFWRKVHKTEMSDCCEWNGYRHKHLGYGMFWVNGKRIYAHRFSWELHNGPIPEGMNVLHKCDNRPCVRIEHLFLGTRQENQRDMYEKGRSPRGERNGRVKLTESQVLEIRRTTGTQEAIAQIFGVTRSTIGHIKARKGWKHI